MLLTAQRVYSPATRKQGVNVYQYLHGPYTWEEVPDEFLPHSNVGELVSNVLSIPHGGNRILSYLDLVVFDEVDRPHLDELLAMIRKLEPSGNPTTYRIQDAWVRFFCWPKIPWGTELHALIGQIELFMCGRSARVATS